MTNKLFSLLYNIIPKTYVSVENNSYISCYYFYLPRGIGEDAYVEISCGYSHIDNKNAYAKYQLYIDDELLYEAFKPIALEQLINKDAKQIYEEKNELADKLEKLLELCSTQIIVQEMKSRNMHMLKTFAVSNNQHTH